MIVLHTARRAMRASPNARRMKAILAMPSRSSFQAGRLRTREHRQSFRRLSREAPTVERLCSDLAEREGILRELHELPIRAGHHGGIDYQFEVHATTFGVTCPRAGDPRGHRAYRPCDRGAPRRHLK